MNKECIILAGGLGTRLKSVVNETPKCMALVANKPFLSYLFDQLEQAKFSHIVLALGYKAEIIINWLQNQKRSFNISYIIEEEPLGTGGAIKLALSKIKGENTFILNGDTLFRINFQELLIFHKDKEADISLALKKMTEFDRYGSVNINHEGRITKFEEKKYLEQGLINGGIYIINKNIFVSIDTSSKFSFEKEVLENKVEDLKIFGLSYDDYFIDIGIPTDYDKANIDFLNFK